MSGPGIAPNKVPVDEEPEKKDTYQVRKNLDFGRILAVALALLACFVAWILITEGADILERLVRHILNLFRRARIYPYPNEEFIQLVLITVFVGWAVRRFRNK